MTDAVALDDPLAWLHSQSALAADPVRLRVLQALARRAAAQPAGPLRERLTAQLTQRADATPTSAPVAMALAPRPRPLADLLAQLTRLHADAGPELRSMQTNRRAWGELRLARRMAEVSAPVPEQLGPLNSQVLVGRALQQLRAISPEYLQRFLTQLDTLAALAPLQAAAKAEKAAQPAAKKSVPKRR
jgi:hypothetical protein